MDLLEKLSQPPTSAVNSIPLVTTLQELPYDELSWENFEKLCVRIGFLEGKIEVCRPYGVRGDSQEGIDIYIKQIGNEKYITYQCKNEKSFGPQKIRDAVGVFSKGEWYNKTEKFVLCCRESLAKQQRTDEIEKQRALLGSIDILFEVLDCVELDLLLKGHPQIVYDFFGPLYTKAFCGEAALSLITKNLPEKKECSCPEYYIERSVELFGINEYKGILNERSEVDLLNLIKNGLCSKVSLIGGAGIGKSVELDRIAYELYKNSDFYPVKFRINSYAGDEIETYVPSFDTIPTHRLILLIDGLDEVQPGLIPTAKHKIEKFANKYPLVKIIVSCRSNFFVPNISDIGQDGTLQDFETYNLRLLSNQKINEYLKANLKIGSIENFNDEVYQNGLDSLIDIPFYFIRFVTIYNTDGKLPKDKVDFFEKLISESISKDTDRYYHGETIQKKALRAVVEKMAFVLEFIGKNSTEYEALSNILKTESDIDLLTRSSLLVGSKNAGSSWMFTHNNIQEYLAANSLSKLSLSKIKEIIAFKPGYKKIKPSWVNTFSFLLSISNEQGQLHDQLLEWVISIEPELLLKGEIDKIDAGLRHRILVTIFNKYKNQGRPINRIKIRQDELARFSSCRETINFLFNEISGLQPSHSRISALEILSYFERIPDDLVPVLKAHLQNNFNDQSEYGDKLKYNSIELYLRNCKLNDQEIISILTLGSESTNTNIRYITYHAIHKCNLQDKFIDLVIKFSDNLIHSIVADKKRLSNEYSDLKTCFENLHTEHAILKTLDFCKYHYDEVTHTIQFSKLVSIVINNAGERFPHSIPVFNSIISLIISGRILTFSDETKAVIEFFKISNSVEQAFKEIYQALPDRYDKYYFMSALANDETMEFLAIEFKQGRVDKAFIENYQYHINDPKSLLKLNGLVNEKEVIPMPVIRNHREEEDIKNKNNINILFDKQAFLSAIDIVYQNEGKTAFTYKEIWDNDRQGRFMSNYLEVVINTIQIYAHQKALIRDQKVLRERIEMNWEFFSLIKLKNYLLQHSSAILTPQQVETIKTYSISLSAKIDFKTGLRDNGDSTSVREKEEVVSYFIRKLNIKSLSQEVYLDLLSFQRYDDSEIEIFSFVESILAVDVIKPRVLENLRSGIVFWDVLQGHLEFCKKHKITESKELLILYLEPSNGHSRSTVLDLFVELNGATGQLKGILRRTQDRFKFDIINYLIKSGDKDVETYLVEEFQKSTSNEDKLELSNYLNKCQNLSGLEFYYQYVKKEKTVPGDSSPSNSLYSIRSIKAIGRILDLYELSFDKTIRQDSYNNLQNIALNALAQIMLQENNFPAAMAIVSRYILKKKIMFKFLNLFRKEETYGPLIQNLLFNLENIESQYYVNKATEVSVEEALNVYGQLH